MKKHSLLIIALLLLAFQNLSFAQTNKRAEIRRIEAYCKTVDAFINRNKKPHLVFADISDYNDDSKAKWRKFASDKALEKFRERSETYTIAYNWRKNGRLIHSAFTLFSPSGDWANYVYHYFRSDGTLAKVKSELRTFYGDLIVLQTLHFDAKGRLLRKTIQYKDLRTGKPKKPEKEYLEGTTDFVSGKDYFKKVNKLPFAKLLRQKR
jgi:hypothetical protein